MVRAGLTLVVVMLLGLGCDSSDPITPQSGTVTFGADEGADFLRGVVRDPGNFANSDLYASRNGEHLKLATGGADPTVNRPVTWFKQGGIPKRYTSLAEVPNDLPPDTQPEALLTTQTGNGFVLKRKDGGYTKGWIAAADASSLTIEFAPVDE